MYLGTQEIDIVKDNIITFKNGQTLQIEEKNKKLFTDEAITASELQDKMQDIIAEDIIEVLKSHNARLIDFNAIVNLINETINAKNEEAVANVFWKEKLNVLSTVFGSNENLDSLAVRNIRIKDIFKS